MTPEPHTSFNVSVEGDEIVIQFTSGPEDGAEWGFEPRWARELAAALVKAADIVEEAARQD